MTASGAALTTFAATPGHSRPSHLTNTTKAGRERHDKVIVWFTRIAASVAYLVQREILQILARQSKDRIGGRGPRAGRRRVRGDRPDQYGMG
jgi:hypothetical protein